MHEGCDILDADDGAMTPMTPIKTIKTLSILSKICKTKLRQSRSQDDGRRSVGRSVDPQPIPDSARARQKLNNFIQTTEDCCHDLRDLPSSK